MSHNVYFASQTKVYVLIVQFELFIEFLPSLHFSQFLGREVYKNEVEIPVALLCMKTPFCIQTKAELKIIGLSYIWLRPPELVAVK